MTSRKLGEKPHHLKLTFFFDRFNSRTVILISIKKTAKILTMERYTLTKMQAAGRHGLGYPGKELRGELHALHEIVRTDKWKSDSIIAGGKTPNTEVAVLCPFYSTRTS
jgi:hypothetical protein